MKSKFIFHVLCDFVVTHAHHQTLHPAEEKYQEARNAFFEVVHAGGGNNFELPLRKPDGEVVHSEINISVMRLQDRCYIQCIVRDITERKRLELALEENEHRLEEMFEHMSSGVAVYRVSPPSPRNVKPRARRTRSPSAPQPRPSRCPEVRSFRVITSAPRPEIRRTGSIPPS